MNRIAVGLLALAALVAGCGEWKLARETVSLNGAGWRFARDLTPEAQMKPTAEAFDDSTWDAVEVPHDWAIAGPFDPDAPGGSGKLPWRGVGWYRRDFQLSEEQMDGIRAGGALWLEFDGVMARPSVHVNGKLAGGWNYGYMGFRVDASELVHVGRNTLAVRADTRDHHSRWYPGAGIYRAVRLVVAPALHVVPDSLFVSTPAVAKQSATVHVAFTVTNRLDGSRRVEAGVRIAPPGSADGVVAEGRTSLSVEAKGTRRVSFDLEVRNPRLWDLEKPELYTATAGVLQGGRLDVQATRFGVRTAVFTADDGFHLNGRRVQLHGVDLHSDMGPLGMAFNRSVMRRQLQIMKDMGANALRTSHNACDPQVLELCDEMGFVVWNECFDKWEGTSGRRNDENLEDYVAANLRAFAKRDRNHPSVVAWSIGNEIPTATTNYPAGMSEARFHVFRNAIREFDATRPVGIGCCHGDAIARGLFAELDITGWNYGGQYRNIKARHPDKPVVYTESASAVSSYGHFEQPPAASKTDYDVKAGEVGAYEHNAAPWSDIPDVEFARMERDRYCAGEFVWTGIDYLGEPTPYVRYESFPMMEHLKNEELARSSYFGIVDLMGIPKERYWLYKSHWNRAAGTVHISPHWNWAGREGKATPVYVYTDADEAELFLNGRSLGRRVKGVPQRPVNLAKGGVATASSVERKPGVENAPALALDGQTDSRWCASGPRKGEWWQVDLGKKTAFSRILVSGEQEDGTYAWTIRLSDDGTSWRDYAKKPLGAAQEQQPKRDAARYVRVVFDDQKPGAWASVRDVVVSDCADGFRLNPYYDVCDRYRLRWFDVPYEPGELKAVAYRGGRKTGEAVVRTAGKPVAVSLTPEQDTLPDDGETCVFVQVDVVDAAGVRDPLAKDRVSFSLTGPGRILAVGNGNPRAHESFAKTDAHPLYFGKAVAVVRREAGTSAPIVLKASVDGLQPAEIRFK